MYKLYFLYSSNHWFRMTGFQAALPMEGEAPGRIGITSLMEAFPWDYFQDTTS